MEKMFQPGNRILIARIIILTLNLCRQGSAYQSNHHPVNKK
jgi:hypothetical protein